MRAGYLYLLILGCFLAGCPGPDFTPVYFPGADGGTPGGSAPAPDKPAPEAAPFAVTKLVIDAQGKEVPVAIPEGNQLEVSTGAFLASDATDIGPRFQATAKFQITNVSKKEVPIQIAPVVGPFTIVSTRSLHTTLKPNAAITITVTFRPDRQTVKQAGRVSLPLTIGTAEFTLTGVALEPQGRIAVDQLTADGAVAREHIDQLIVGDVAVPAAAQRAYFQCATLACAGAPMPTTCQPCVDVAAGACQLLAVGRDGLPIDEVKKDCTPAHPRGAEQSLIHFGADATQPFAPVNRTLAIRNMGPKPLTLTAVTLHEVANSHSTGQFHIGLQPATLPITLAPYEPPLSTEQAVIVVGYSPTDLVGADGKIAGVGTSVTDQATLTITTDGGTEQVRIKGTTAIKDVPPLQVYFTTTTGLKERADGQDFAFRGVTGETMDLAVPLFIQAPEGVGNAIRVVGIGIGGPDAAAFEWLDTLEKIFSKPEAQRCTIPLFDSTGGQTGVRTDLKPIALAPNGYDLKPGAFTTTTMPLFGCVNFHRDPNDPQKTKREFHATLTITAQKLGSNRQPIRNSDGTIKESAFHIPLVAVINPRKGKMVLRLVQTMSTMLNAQFPTVASVSSKGELESLIAQGLASPKDMFVFLGSIILDPFDEETIANEQGSVISKPGDGITGVFRGIDTHPSPLTYDDATLPDYANLTFDLARPKGNQGVFFDYPNLPTDFRAPALRIFTSTLSYPGPTAETEEKPDQPSQCEVVDPCNAEGQRKFGSGPTEAGKKGVCAYFYTSAGAYQSPAFQFANAMEGGERQDLCKVGATPRKINDWMGHYTLDGNLTFEDGGLLFWGPTYFHNPNGPLGPVPPLDEVFHLSLTTETLLPSSETPGVNLLPETRLNISKSEYKINLNDPTLETPAICPGNTHNRPLSGKNYSTWRYLIPFLTKDPKGATPAGCPEEGSPFTGGSAYVHGRRVDHATGIFSVVGNAKFSSRDELTFAFKDVTIFIFLNGWLCDPEGSPDEMEGERCFDRTLNDRDAQSQISITEHP